MLDRIRIAPAAVLIALVLVSYSPAYRAGFVWDDDDHVSNNLALRSIGGLMRIWFEPGATPQYYPLTHTSFWIEYRFWGAWAPGYHVVNVLLHAANAVLLWRLLRRIGLPAAWAIALIFAVHPMQVESVAWITERKNTLSFLFYLLAMHVYLPLAGLDSGASAWNGLNGEPVQRSESRYARALLLFVAAMLSKTVACSWPAAVLLLIWWRRGRITLADVRPLAPFFAVGIVLAVVTVLMEVHNVGATGPQWAFSPLDRVLIAGRALWFYAGKLAWPASLAFIYPRWAIDDGSTWQYLYPLSALLLVGAAWLARRHIGRGPLVALLFFGGTLVPALGFFNIYPMRYSFVADHFQYVAGAGLIALLVSALHELAQRRGLPTLALPAAATVLALGLSMLSWRQSQAYASAETLWRDTLAKNPDCAIAHYNVGFILDARGDYDAAIRHLEEAVRLAPDETDALNNLANTYARAGRGDQALAAFQEALRRKPSDEVVLYNLGVLYGRMDKPEEAIKYYAEALRIRPDMAEAQSNLAAILVRRADEFIAARRMDQAVALLDQAVAAHPADYESHRRLGAIHADRGRWDDAALHFAAAAEAQPSDVESLFLLGRSLVQTGRTADAVKIYRDCLKVRPDAPGVLSALAWILATDPDDTVRKGDEAVRLAEQAAKLTQHENPPVLDALAAAYAETGRFDLAIQTAERAVELLDEPEGAQLMIAVKSRLVQFYMNGAPFREIAPAPSAAPASG